MITKATFRWQLTQYLEGKTGRCPSPKTDTGEAACLVAAAAEAEVDSRTWCEFYLGYRGTCPCAAFGKARAHEMAREWLRDNPVPYP